MLEAIAAAALVLAGSTVCGCAVRGLSGLTPRSAGAPALGFALLIVLAGITVRLPGRTDTATAVLGLALIGSAVYLLRRRAPTGIPLWAGLTAAATLAVALLPFLVSGRVGLLGVGTNDDLSEHLLAAWTLTGHAALSSNKLIASGYPIGPHALVAVLAKATGISLERAFTALILAVPALLALAAGSFMRVGPRALRGVASGAVGLCYLQAAYLVQASFKEPMEAVVLVAFAGALDELERHPAPGRLACTPLAVLAAAAVYIYSYLGLAWLGAALLIWRLGKRAVTGRRREPRRRRAQRALAAPATAAIVFLALVGPELPRMISFRGSGYNRETADVYGNLIHALPPQEALGIWPRMDFRFDVPLWSFAGILALLALLAVLWALARALQRGELVLPAAVLATAALYAISTTGSPYSAAKAQVILAPLLTLVLAREALVLLAGPGLPRSRAAPAAALGVLLVAGAYSDLQALRDGPVGPDGHVQQLASLRPLIGAAPTLFLGADDYIHWELRGADIATPPAPLYTRVVVALRRTKAHQDPRLYRPADATSTRNRFAGLGLGFDFDSVPGGVLDRFTFAIVPRSSYRSQPPANWRLVKTTESYELWRREGETAPRQTLTEVDHPGAILDCRSPSGRALAGVPGIAMVQPAPVIGERVAWRGPRGWAGRSAHQSLALGRGSWDVSLQYDGAAAVTVRGPGLRTVLPATLESLGPYWFAGTLHLARPRRVRLSVAWAPLTAFGRAVGAAGLTRAPAPTGLSPLGRIVATRAGSPGRTIPLSQACGSYVDWYRRF